MGIYMASGLRASGVEASIIYLFTYSNLALNPYNPKPSDPNPKAQNSPKALHGTAFGPKKP